MKINFLETIIDKYKVQTIGYADCIVSHENVKAFVDELSEKHIAVVAVDWFCHCTPNNIKKYGCPHGLGGPKSVYYGSYFSELTHFGTHSIKSNANALDYIFNIAPKDKSYSPCLFPSLCLDVSYIDFLSQEYLYELSDETRKYFWETAVKCIENIGYPLNAEFLPKLVWLIKNPTWAGANDALSILSSLDKAIILPLINNAIKKALAENDEIWLKKLESLAKTTFS